MPRRNESLSDDQLLQEAPETFLRRMQPLMRRIVDHFVHQGYFLTENREDILQNLNERLWQQGLQRMREQYDGRTQLRTYFAVVVRGMCRNEARKARGQQASLLTHSRPLLPWHRKGEPDFEHRQAIVRELLRLRGMFGLVSEKRDRLEFCLRLWLRLPLSREVLEKYAPQARESTRAAVLQQLGRPDYPQMQDREVFGAVAGLVSEAEGQAVAADSLRRWTRAKVTELIRLLNGIPPRAYDEETFALLLHTWFDQGKLAAATP